MLYCANDSSNMALLSEANKEKYQVIAQLEYAEMHELVTLARVYYLLAGPRLAEAHDSCTTVPLTGSDRSIPKSLTDS